uniref:E3 ubiquitin-protein ligase n=1 Tax=Caenorhabditis japonica TaxID=281687 RepID=A0A8R1DW72_CAEJA
MSGVGSSSEVQEDCTICDYEKLMPTEIPNCGHQFCYSCIKGVFLSNSPICLLCRGPIDEAIFTTERDVDVKMKVPGLREPDFSVRRFVNNKGVQLTELKPDVEIIRARMNAEAARMFWVYRGRNNGWWRFESRNEKDIEDFLQPRIDQTTNAYCRSFVYCGFLN